MTIAASRTLFLRVVAGTISLICAGLTPTAAAQVPAPPANLKFDPVLDAKRRTGPNALSPSALSSGDEAGTLKMQSSAGRTGVQAATRNPGAKSLKSDNVSVTVKGAQSGKTGTAPVNAPGIAKGKGVKWELSEYDAARKKPGPGSGRAARKQP